ncbi:hypothetical protein V5G24_20380 [Xanthobacter sp. VTT E-85241]|uniref:hypothetical protein n=1 Tax=Roseixanthobacter finlandensis TaxID=3119922 RepID=UPI00372C5D99
MVGKPDTQAGAKLYVCTAPQTALPLDAAAFAALTWVQVKKVGQISDMGTDTNIVNYDTLDTDVSQKGKGVTNGGDWTIEVARVYDDAGQTAMRAAALTGYDYAFKVEYADAPSAGYTNTIMYNCGLVTGPRKPGGGVEDFILEQFTLAMNQRDVVVDPTVIP